MNERMELLTARARRSLTLAEEEARAFNHNYIGTEHLLLGLVRVEDGVAARVLEGLGISAERIRQALVYIIGRGSEPVTGPIGLTPRAKKALDLSLDEAKRLNHHYIGTEHLLLGLLREGEGIATGVLTTLGATVEGTRAAILKMLSEGLNSIPADAEPVEAADVGHLVAQWVERDRSVKRYNLALPEELYDQVQSLAERQQTTVVEVLRRFIKLGLLATEVQERRDAALIIREGEREREILLL